MFLLILDMKYLYKSIFSVWNQALWQISLTLSQLAGKHTQHNFVLDCDVCLLAHTCAHLISYRTCLRYSPCHFSFDIWIHAVWHDADLNGDNMAVTLYFAQVRFVFLSCFSFFFFFLFLCKVCGHLIEMVNIYIFNFRHASCTREIKSSFCRNSSGQFRFHSIFCTVTDF